MKQKPNRTLSLPWTPQRGNHSHKYLYQLSSTCEQKPIGKKQHLYERKAHQTKMADFILQGVRQISTQALDFSGKNVAFLAPPKNLS